MFIASAMRTAPSLCVNTPPDTFPDFELKVPELRACRHQLTLGQAPQCILQGARQSGGLTWLRLQLQAGLCHGREQAPAG